MVAVILELELNSILKKCIETDESGQAWASSLVGEDGMQAAPLHELIISHAPVKRLNDLTAEQETACWNLAMIRARVALKTPGINAVGFLVNDGAHAGQTVGHVHLHVIGFHHNRSDMAVGEELGTLSQKFLGNAMTRPLALEKGLIAPDNLVAIRDIRKNFASIQNAGFSIYTERPLKGENLSEPLPFVVECWSPNAPRAYGLTNLIRVLNGYRDAPYSWPAKNLERTFAPLLSVKNGMGSV